MAITRISVTIPEDVLLAADSEAQRLGRSRSWLVVEALRQFLSGRSAAPQASAGARRVVEARPASDTGLGESRLQQLESDLALSNEERVIASERSALVAQLRRPSWRRACLLVFDRYEDYLDWSRWEESTPR